MFLRHSSLTAIHGPKAYLIMGRRPMYPRAEGPFTSPLKAAIHGPKARTIIGRRTAYVAAEGGNLRAEGPFTSPPKAAFVVGRPMYSRAEGLFTSPPNDSRAKGRFNHGPKAHVPRGRRPVYVAAEGGNLQAEGPSHRRRTLPPEAAFVAAKARHIAAEHRRLRRRLSREGPCTRGPKARSRRRRRRQFTGRKPVQS